MQICKNTNFTKLFLTTCLFISTQNLPMNFLKKVKLQIRTSFIKNKVLLLKALSPFKNYKVKDSIIISSETRSGSTWLMEMLHSSPKMIINWEPIHEIKGVVPANFRWGERPYIPEDENNKEAYKIMDKTFRFKLFSENSVRYCSLKDILRGKQVLTKMVRSNLLLPWLVNNFEFKHKPIYLLRHPIAVAKSQNQKIPEDQYNLSSYQIPDTINNERYKENFSFISGLNSLLERRVALWCIHNMEIINHPDNGDKWVMVFYENLVMDPQTEITRVINETNLDIDISKIVFNKPSRTDWFNEVEKDKISQLSKWKDGLTKDELKNIQNVFEHYKLKHYSAFDILPLMEAN